MKLVNRIKKKVGTYFLKNEGDSVRRRKGSSFATATDVALLYEDSSEDFFKKVKNYVRYLHEEHGVKKVMAFGFIDTDQKNVPIWHSHKLEFEYFTREDLNWHLKPSREVKVFTECDYDILIDLTTHDCVPLKYVVANSKAKMKVGRMGGVGEDYYDFLIDIKPNESLDTYINQVNFYLTNMKIQ
jgi:hypothetical protein